MIEPTTSDPSILSADSVTRLGSAHVGAVLVAGSHGGVYAACLAARAGLRAVILNDAGIGLDEAGIAGLAYLDGFGAAAALLTAAPLPRARPPALDETRHLLRAAPGEPQIWALDSASLVRQEDA